MAKFMYMVVIAVVLLNYTTAQTVHVVGDNVGWTVPTTTGAYNTWAASKSFVVGDVLTFNFVTNEHDVQQVTKASYDACTSSNPIGTLITTGPANITLDTAGDHYYICTVGRHCQFGQKLSITVSATQGTSPTGNPAPTPPTTLSPNSGTPVDCAPTSGPTASTTPSGPSNSPPQSSSPIVLASVSVSMLAILMSLFF